MNTRRSISMSFEAGCGFVCMSGEEERVATARLDGRSRRMQTHPSSSDMQTDADTADIARATAALAALKI